MFTDEVDIKVSGGKGGDGIVNWRREKYINKGGPDGGDGGDGGDVYFEAVRSLSLLNRYKKGREYSAEDGKGGKGRLQKGKDGEDLVLQIPVGSIIENLDTKEIFEMLEDRERVLVATGGEGGLGNDRFKSSRNTTPTEYTEGKKGQSYNIRIKLHLIADIGLIGLPSAGKSTLLNEITNSNAKVGSYPFTTLEPNLGVCDGIIVADLPGLIEGAAKGKGLGHKFLRHISRTKKLLHLVSVENDDIVGAYETVRSELKSYDNSLTEKEEIIVLSKVDLMEEEKVMDLMKELSKFGKVIKLSVLDKKYIQKTMDEIKS